MRLPVRHIKLLCLVLSSACVGVFLTLAMVSYENTNTLSWKVREWNNRGMDTLHFQVETKELLSHLSQGSHPNPTVGASQVREGTPHLAATQAGNESLHHPYDKASQRMESRKQLIKQMCSSKNITEPSKPVIRNQALHNRKYSLYYCPVEKTASTFWRRFFYQLDFTNPVRSPFDVRIPIALSSMGRFRLTQKDEESIKQIMASSTKMMFVRDPYSRLYSAYVDKLMAPNPVFWQAWGQPAVKKARNITGEDKGQGKVCGDDVTFLEFIREALRSIWKKDVHVIPIVDLCTPCSISYDVIGKMESFIDDATSLVDILGIDPVRLRLEALKNDSVADAIEDSATDALSAAWLRATLRCISRDAVARRIWRKLQLRGFISWRRKFPLTENQTMHIRSPEFIRILKKESALSTDEKELKLQKKQGMKEAFASLAPSDFEGIETIFGKDFKLFGFDISTLKNVGTLGVNVKDTQAFDWRKDWDLSPIL